MPVLGTMNGRDYFPAYRRRKGKHWWRGKVLKVMEVHFGDLIAFGTFLRDQVLLYEMERADV